MKENIYATPKSELIKDSGEESTLATRWQRLWASMLDGLVIMVLTVPAMYLSGGYDGIFEGVKPSLKYTLLIGALGLIVFFIINGNLLIKHGQTIGKKIVGIKIVDLEGNLPSLKHHLIKRYAVYFIPGQIPVVGQFISIINILFIFGKQKRCVHDFVAGTKVKIS